MGMSLVERSAAARELFREAGDILGFDLINLCSHGPAEQLNRTEFSQPALFVHSLAALKLLAEERSDLWNQVGAAAGLSLGEYTALAATGAMSFSQGLRLVQTRGAAMQAAADITDSGMSSIVGLDQDRLQAICEQASGDGHFVRIANLLCPGNIAISGHLSALAIAERLCTEAGAMMAVRLQVAGAFHTSIMQPAVSQLSLALSETEFSASRVPVYSNVDAAGHQQPEEFRDLLARQVTGPVLWEAALRNMMDAGCTEFIELGAGRVLAGTLKRINRKVSCEAYG
jgi:[acyl-carrier-protein] S-malonyltransferase